MPNNNKKTPQEYTSLTGGRLYQNKEIDLLYHSIKNKDNNILDKELYYKSIAIILYAFQKMGLKDILPIAKEIIKSNKPNLNYNVNLVSQIKWEDLQSIHGILLNQGKGTIEDKGIVKIEDKDNGKGKHIKMNKINMMEGRNENNSVAE